LRARGDFYRHGLESLLGPGRAGDIVLPNRLVTDRDSIDLGGRILHLRAHPVAHTNCDLSALDEATGTWLAGDLLFVNRVPSLDGSLHGWIDELEASRMLPASWAVPGHGPVRVPWPAGSDDQLRYLRTLRRDVSALIERGGQIEQAPLAAADERAHWVLFDDYNGRNATEAFKELEWQ
jgi:glyoxylase-like metal-dependent hydrolase (beta-lactamase superfamily II)